MNTLEKEISEAFELMATNDLTDAQRFKISEAALRFDKSGKSFLSLFLLNAKIAAVAGIAAAVLFALHLAHVYNISFFGAEETSDLKMFTMAEYGETSLCIADGEYIVRRESRHKWSNEIEAYIASEEVKEFFRANVDSRFSNEVRNH